MQSLLTLAALQPLFHIGGSVILGWLLTFVLIAAIVWMIVWAATKVFGPPSFPEPVRWILWIIVAIGVIIFVFAALGVGIP